MSSLLFKPPLFYKIYQTNGCIYRLIEYYVAIFYEGDLYLLIEFEL